MALHLSKSRYVISSIRSKLGFLAMMEQTNWSSEVTQKLHTSPSVTIQNLRNPDEFSCKTPTVLATHRWESTMAPKHSDDSTENALNYPGGKVKFTSDPNFISGSQEERIHCYRVLDENGQPISSNNFIEIDKEVAVKMYVDMVTLQVMDTIFYEAQRQGRISFYLTSIGEEAINIASAAALNFDDLVFPQYREPGVLLWRGFTLQEFANQCFGNKGDYGKGRQMSIHYGSNKHNYITVASTVGTQVPRAVGAAYSVKMDGKDACTITYFGDGGSSTGDFHAALNFAAVMDGPSVPLLQTSFEVLM